ncbi:MAG: YybH family protein [Runella sp.]
MTPIATIDAFYQAIIDKKSTEIAAYYVPSENTYVVLEGPRYTTLGHANIAKGWSDFCDSPLLLQKIEWVEGPFEEAISTMAWVAGQIILTVEVKGKTFTVQFRATFVLLQNKEGRWQIKHEHVSGPLPDPYGIGDWLKKTD